MALAPEPQDDFTDLDDLDSFEPGWPAADPRPTAADDVMDDVMDDADDDGAGPAAQAESPAEPTVEAAAPSTQTAAEPTAEPAAAPDLKKGVRTTEFWQTFLTQLLAFGVSVAALFGGNIDSTALQALVPAAALLASAGASAHYASSRSKVKSAHASTVAPTAGG